jgi:excisionase family DNA binding protein
VIDLWASAGPFTIDELAEVCRVSEALVRKAIKCKTLEARKLGRVVRIPASAARRFALDLGVEPSAPGARSARGAPGAPADANPRRMAVGDR